MGPAVVITVGVLLLLHQIRGGIFDFSDTWPLILIVIGAILFGSSLAPTTGHIEEIGPPRVPSIPPTPGSPQTPTGGPGR